MQFSPQLKYSAIFTRKYPLMQMVSEFGQITMIILKSHDKNMAALCICCGELKSKFDSLQSKNVFYMN